MGDRVSLASKIVSNSEVDRLRRFQVERYKEISRLYRQVSRFDSLEDLVDYLG